MKNEIGKIVARIAFCMALIAGVGAPLAAQITIKCWKEGCITIDGQTSCIREEIPCPKGN
jgi:hypothetical protein